MKRCLLFLILLLPGCGFSLLTSNNTYYYEYKGKCSKEELSRCSSFHISTENCDCKKSEH